MKGRMNGQLSVTYYKGEVEINDGYNSLVVEIVDCKFIVNCITLTEDGEVYLEDSIRGSKFILHVVATCDKLLISTEVNVPRHAPLIFEVEFHGNDVIQSLKTKLIGVIENERFELQVP